MHSFVTLMCLTKDKLTILISWTSRFPLAAVDLIANEDPMDNENQSENNEDLFQSDESDRDTQFGDDEEDYDLFSRLEESRAELEGELGCDRFLKVYKTVQALQEDEDENIEEGAKLVTNILGKDKEHLYPKIFQLVMADAAFTEEQNQSN